MGWTKRWRKRLRALLRKDAVERELDEELGFHLQMETQKNLRAGMSPDEARRQARIAFGGVEGFKEEVRDARTLGWVSGMALDFKLALRMLRKHLALSVVGGLGMAVGVAIAACFFTYMTAFYYSQPPVEEGERIVAIENRNLMNSEGEDWGASLFDFHIWRENLRSVQDLAAFRKASYYLQIPSGMSKRVQVAEMTASGFRVARVSPLLGRPLLDSDEAEGAPPVVVIGYDEWQRYFGADSGVIGREVRLGGIIHEVVGVMPEGFLFPVNHGFWTALPTDRSLYGPGEGPSIVIFGRLAPGASQADAQAELALIGERLSADLPAVYEHLRPAILPYVRPLLDVQQYPAWWVWAMQLFGILVLTVVAVNVAVLVYARTAARHGEIAVRTALGAGRRRIVTQLFLEALALSLAAAGFGLLIAKVGYGQLFAIADARFLPYWIRDEGLPEVTIPYAIGLAVLAAFLVGVMPALRATGPHLQSTLRQIGGGTNMRLGSTWTVLIVAQVAIAVAVLPVVVGTLLNAFWRTPPTPTFPSEEILTFRLNRVQDPFGARGGDLEPSLANQQAELIRRVAAEPAVSGVTYALNLPPSADRIVRLEAEPALATTDPIPTLVHSVGLEYFDVLGVQFLAGRRFERDDLLDGARTVIVNRAFGQRLLGGGDALGRRVREMTGIGRHSGEGEPWYGIVGVVGDMYQNRSMSDRGRPVMYRPITAGQEALWILARTRGTAPADLAPRVREIAAQVAPAWQLSVQPMNARFSGPDQDMKTLMALVVGLITLSVLLLSAAGISALMSFAVTRRQRDIGIRIALGASHGRIMAAIFSRSAGQLALGLVVGTAAGGMLDRVAGGELLGGRAVILLPLVAVMMVVAGLLATLGPARRALRIQPVEALREE